MGVSKSALTSERDVYIDYPFEQVMFRWDCAGQVIYRKFYGEPEFSDPVPLDNRLFFDALTFGDVITAEEYVAGKRHQ